MSSRREKKVEYAKRLTALFEEYDQIMFVGADNVGSHHMQQIRQKIRGKAVLLMGKNTMIRRVIRMGFMEKFGEVIPRLEGNVGLVFTHGSLSELRDELLELRVGAPAKAGVIAPSDVVVPAGDTGLEPTQTASLQQLNIATRINKGQIMILNDAQIITKGNKVGASEAALLQKLNIKPFSYGLSCVAVYDHGSVYDADVLAITDDDIIAKFSQGVLNVACVSLQIGLPSVASIRHSLANAYKNVLSIALATELEFEQCKELKALLNDPEALAAAMAAGSGAAPAAETGADETSKAEEEEEEEEEEGMFDMFG
mmetsp:Transcript_3331/g.11712  ORF Transcript_3331/g.11712 Transcript_3331/m.11712 type:complete len:313 (-) Transcript_3331:57-995(-)|eukprot:CAMPEP_0114630282 /NCGR_PEP_ID=MMETSP0168-20121206/13802_1 /TAXON_ID=95228 ORGANISM="Vannella sp., Strain DIVA3 517/6/12" /NCGR_SAMPLE_ID=MMETSP0168 /ASSEMBLY_ACC=CAM_ASM_000044 /LENGTH=312 /DNA_ID=CAMNT_0001841783 /DNA_START=65 /DNA_END=1003 /DNA_ORIENTATION=-